MTDDDVVAACRHLAAAMGAFEARVAERLGVGPTDLRAINLLEDGGVHPSVIASGLGVTRSTVTALVDRLEAAGLVRRTPDPGDRRAVLVELTPSTWRDLADLYGPAGRRVGATAAAWSDETRARVVEGIGELAAAFDGPHDGA